MSKDRITEKKKECFSDHSLWECTFENADEEKPTTLEKVKFYVDNFFEGEKYYYKGIGLVLNGGVGNGKTYAAACIANALIRNFQIRMTDIGSLYQEWNAPLRNREDIIERIKSYTLLILDDLGAEQKDEAMREMVCTIIEERLKSRKPTIVTTNMSAEELSSPADPIMERIYSKLCGMCISIAFTGVKNRYKKKMRSNTEEFTNAFWRANGVHIL